MQPDPIHKVYFFTIFFPSSFSSFRLSELATRWFWTLGFFAGSCWKLNPSFISLTVPLHRLFFLIFSLAKKLRIWKSADSYRYQWQIFCRLNSWSFVLHCGMNPHHSTHQKWLIDDHKSRCAWNLHLIKSCLPDPCHPEPPPHSRTPFSFSFGLALTTWT